MGIRHNKGKEGMSLLPLFALKEIAKVYDFGSKKYSPWNWAKGLSWSDTLSSMLRHTSEWQAGKDLDEESKLHHDVHIAWNAITLVALRLMGKGQDDRPKI